MLSICLNKKTKKGQTAKIGHKSPLCAECQNSCSFLVIFIKGHKRANCARSKLANRFFCDQKDFLFEWGMNFFGGDKWQLLKGSEELECYMGFLCSIWRGARMLIWERKFVGLVEIIYGIWVVD
jgi:hypothetical protein